MSEQKQIFLVGLNHTTASVEVREKFALTSLCAPENWAIPVSEKLEEILILSTCNRVEIVSVSQEANAEELLITAWADAVCQDVEELKSYVYVHKDISAIKHLFAVASSLDSLVLGEPQILGQLKVAYKKSVEAQTAGAVINRLLHKAFTVAKRVRTETALASSAVSISYAAVELAKRIFDVMPNHDALVIGAGEMAELAALHLKQAGIRKIYVANRTFANAEELAEKIKGEAVEFIKVAQYLAEVDIVISSTGSTTTLLSAKDLKPIIKQRRYKPMFFIDIAMPRDIDPDVNNLDNVYLYDIDDLKEVVEENLAQRRSEATKAWEIVEDECQDFLQWVVSLKLQPTIVALNNKTEFLAMRELERTLKKLPQLDEATKEELVLMMQSLVRKVNHAPLIYLKNHHDRAIAVATVKRVFNLD